MGRKYDCSKVLDFLHERERMCKLFRGAVDMRNSCKGCPLTDGDSCFTCRRGNFKQKHIDILQTWSDTWGEAEPPTISTGLHNQIEVLWSKLHWEKIGLGKPYLATAISDPSTGEADFEKVTPLYIKVANGGRIEQDGKCDPELTRLIVFLTKGDSKKMISMKTLLDLPYGDEFIINKDINS